jgi:type I restriction enzyme S subunit
MSKQAVDIPEGYRMTELGPLPEEWHVAKGAEVFSVVERSTRKTHVRDDEEYTLLSCQLYGRGVVEKEQVRGTGLKTKVWYRVRSGDFILLKIWARRGSYGFVKPAHDAAIVSGDYPILQLNRGLCYGAFLEWYLSRPQVWESLSYGATGATNRQRVHEREFLRILRVPLPPLAEQKKTAAVLSTVQQAKEKTEAVIAALRELKKSLMKHLFTYGPVPLDEAGSVRLKETEVGMVPEHWEVVPLGEVLKQTQYGLSVKGQRQGRHPILRMSNLEDGHVTARDLQYVDLDERTFGKFSLHAGDVLFNRTNSIDLVGKTAIFGAITPFVFASYLIRLVADKARLAPDYLNSYLNIQATQARLKMLASRGVSQSNISATKLRGFLVPLPSVAEQLHIADQLCQVETALSKEESKESALAQLFRTLLNDLMTAKIRVNDLEVGA